MNKNQLKISIYFEKHLNKNENSIESQIPIIWEALNTGLYIYCTMGKNYLVFTEYELKARFEVLEEQIIDRWRRKEIIRKRNKRMRDALK